MDDEEIEHLHGRLEQCFDREGFKNFYAQKHRLDEDTAEKIDPLLDGIINAGIEQKLVISDGIVIAKKGTGNDLAQYIAQIVGTVSAKEIISFVRSDLLVVKKLDDLDDALVLLRRRLDDSERLIMADIDSLEDDCGINPVVSDELRALVYDVHACLAIALPKCGYGPGKIERLSYFDNPLAAGMEFKMRVCPTSSLREALRQDAAGGGAFERFYNRPYSKNIILGWLNIQTAEVEENDRLTKLLIERLREARKLTTQEALALVGKEEECIVAEWALDQDKRLKNSLYWSAINGCWNLNNEQLERLLSIDNLMDCLLDDFLKCYPKYRKDYPFRRPSYVEQYDEDVENYIRKILKANFETFMRTYEKHAEEASENER